MVNFNFTIKKCFLNIDRVNRTRGENSSILTTAINYYLTSGETHHEKSYILCFHQTLFSLGLQRRYK